jgi:acetyltransferase-like isoleucine patch superfamily enzyme
MDGTSAAPPVDHMAAAPAIDGAANETAPTSRWTRAVLALADEVSNLNFRFFVVDLLVRLLPSLGFPRVRRACYRLAGLKIGADTAILGRLEFTETRNLQTHFTIGAKTIINKRFFVDATGPVHIGDRVSIGHHVVLVTAAHDIGPAARRAGAMRPRGITIEDGCWIGARTTILPGVRIGASSVVAAGSLVAADVPPCKLVGGVPARIIKALPDTP